LHENVYLFQAVIIVSADPDSYQNENERSVGALNPGYITLILARDEHVAHVRLNRPEEMNTLNQEL
jgi:hypothetical protein